MTYAIEKGVTLPRKGGGAHVYPLGEMKIGDSFISPKRDDISPARHQARMSSVLVAFAKTHPGYKFTTRQEAEGVRVWRVAVRSDMLDQSPPPVPESRGRVHKLEDARPRKRA